MKRSYIGFLFGFAALCAALYGPEAHAQKPDILEVITISGGIDGSTAAQIASEVDKIAENPKIKAVLLIVDSPGGTVTASQAIYDELARLKVPVVGWCQSVCASGGVYVLMSPAVKHIAVKPETISGSVGVVMQMMRFNRLLEWAKIDPKTYRSGHLKDAGNPMRPMEDAEDKYLQSIVNSLAEKFYGIVGKSRKIKDWEAVKTAKIFIGDEAVKIGLADAVSTKTEVTAKAKELSGSKTIFTREELKKMSSAAEGGSHYTAPVHEFRSVFRALDTATDAFKEVWAGESVRFEYRMPYQF